MEIIRNEAYYFAPQAMTKIMNEGWATYWHSKLMTEKIKQANMEVALQAISCLACGKTQGLKELCDDAVVMDEPAAVDGRQHAVSL